MKPDELANIIGQDAAMTLMCQMMRTEIYVPEKVTDLFLRRMSHNYDAAAKLVQARGGEKFKVPSGKAWRCKRFAEEGMGVQDIAVLMQVSPQAVKNYLRRVDEN